MTMEEYTEHVKPLLDRFEKATKDKVTDFKYSDTPDDSLKNIRFVTKDKVILYSMADAYLIGIGY